MEKREMAIIAQALDVLLQKVVNISVLSDEDISSLNGIIESEFGMNTESLTIDEAKIVMDYVAGLVTKYKECALINKEDLNWLSIIYPQVD